MSENRFDNASFALSSDGITYTPVEQVQGGSISDTAETVRQDFAGTTASNELHGKDHVTGSFSFLGSAPLGTGQELIYTAKAGQGSDVYYFARFRVATASGYKQYIGRVVLKSIDKTGQSGNYFVWTVPFSFRGAPTISNQ